MPSSRSARSACLQGVDHGAQVAGEHRVQVVGLEADPVVGDPVLTEVVGADPLRAVHGAHLAPPGRGCLGRRLLLGRGDQPGAQHPHRRLLVLQLGALVLAADDDAGRQMGDPHRRVGGVDPLAARSGAAVHVDPQVVGIDLDLGLVGVRHHQDAGGRGVHPALGLGHRHPLHPVHAALELEHPIGERLGFAGRGALIAKVIDL